jgi:UDP-N-acetylglucosamine--dolichyl-phosphate N-acetylglucosaminephosphotransferase
LFPKVPDYHKAGKPLVPTGLGVVYVLASVIYLFLLHFFVESEASSNTFRALTLAVCILFGGFMGLLDDWMDLRWRYKAFFPLIASIPLIALAYRLPYVRTAITIPIVGTIEFGNYYYFILIPLIVTITTNTVNQLGGLNGLETVCPAIVMTGLMAASGPNTILLSIPLIVWLTLALFNFQGKMFVGNTGSFAVGITLAAFAIISDLKWNLMISLLPYIFNSSIILLNYFIFRTKAHVSFDGKKLFSDHRRSLITLITYRRPLTEHQVVFIIAILVATSTFAAYAVQLFLV